MCRLIEWWQLLPLHRAGLSDLEALLCRLTSSHTGADTAAPTKAHGVRDFAETTADRSTGFDANTPDAAAPGGSAGVEALLQRLLLGTPVMASRA